MPDQEQQATENLNDFRQYTSVLMPIVVEFGNNVDFEEVKAEIALEVDPGVDPVTDEQVELVVGIADRFADLYRFMMDMRDRAASR